MIPGPGRRKGGAAQLGVIPGTEDIGPFGRYRDGDPEDSLVDDGRVPAEETAAAVVDERIQRRIEQVAARREARTAQRAELAQRRSHGLKARRRARMRMLPPEPPEPPPDAA